MIPAATTFVDKVAKALPMVTRFLTHARQFQYAEIFIELGDGLRRSEYDVHTWLCQAKPVAIGGRWRITSPSQMRLE